MKAKETVQIDGAGTGIATRNGFRDGNRRTQGAVVLLAKGNDDVQTIGCSALKDRHQDLLPAGLLSGKGRAPKPFMVTDVSGRVTKDAVWDSSVGLAPALRAEKKTSAKSRPKPKSEAEAKKAAELPEFIEPQLCHMVERPPTGPGWVHEIKFDGYRIQARVSGGKAVLRTRKGLDWTGKFSAIAAASGGFPDAIIDGEVVALDANGAPDFAALQAALVVPKSSPSIACSFAAQAAPMPSSRRPPER